MNKARILVITGPGKGKTTSALGVILRALAHGRRVLLTRFCKTAFSGELAVLGKLDAVAVKNGDCGMTPPPDHPDYPRHVRCALDLFAFTRAAAPDFDLLVMDEICGVIARGMVPEAEVVDFLSKLRSDQAAILTGRGAGPGLIAAADTVSEILCVKHAFRRGVEAQEGIEK